MAVLVVAEHDNNKVKKATLSTVAAAHKLGVAPDALLRPKKRRRPRG